MPGGVLFDGKVTRRAGVLAKVDRSESRGRALSQNHLAVVAELPFLEPFKVMESSSRRALESLAPNNQRLQDIVTFIYSCSKDSRVGGAGPSKVLLVSPMATTRAYTELLEAGSNVSLILRAREWGPGGNRIHVEVAPSASPDDGYRDVVLSVGAAQERYPRLGSGPVLNVWFDGDADPSTMTVECAPEAAGGVIVRFTKAAITGAGWAPAGRMLSDGVVTATPSGAGTHSLEVTGVLKTGGAGSETLTWTTEGGQKSGVTEFAEITGIAWDPEGSETVSVAGIVFQMRPASQQVTLKDCATRVNQFAADGYHAALRVGKRVEVVAADALQPASIMVGEGSAPAVKADAYFTRLAIENSALVEVFDGGAGRGRLAAVVTDLAGGTAALDGAAELADWRTAHEALRQADAHTVVPLTTDALVHGVLGEHVSYMRGLGGNECDGVVGATANETLASLHARREALNNKDVALVFQQPERPDANGIVRIYGPEYQALEMAALHCSIAANEAVTWKRAGSDAYHHNTIDPNADGELLLEYGINFVFVDRRGVTKWERVVSTHAEDDDPTVTEWSANRGANTMLRYLRESLEPFVADGDPSNTSLVQQAKKLLREAVALKYIASADYDSVTPVEAGSYVVLDFDFTANIPKNQIVLRPRASRRRLAIAI